MAKIKYEDIVTPGTYEKIIEQGNQLIDVLNRMEAAGKSAMASLKGGLSTGTPKTMADAAAMDKTIKQAEEYHKALLKIEADKRAIQSAEEKARLAEIKLAQDREKAFDKYEKDLLRKQSAEEKANREYVKQSKTLRDLKNAYYDVALTLGKDSAEAQKLLAQLTPLDKKMKDLNKSAGDFHLEVGNYGNALQDVKGGLLEIGSAMGIAFGVHQGVDFLKESIGAFLEAEENANNLKNAVKGNSIVFDRLIEQSEQLQDTSIFSDDDVQIAQKALATYGLTSEQIAKLTPQIVDYASKMKVDLSTATTTAISAINGQTKGLKESGLQFEATGDRVENFNILTEKLTKFQGASAEALESTTNQAKRLKNMFGDIQEVIGEYLVGAGADILDNFEVVFGGKAADIALRRQKNSVLAMMDEVNKESLEKIKSGEKSKSEVIADNSKYIVELYALRGKQQTYEQQQVIDAQIKHQQQFNEELRKFGVKEVNDWDEKEEKKVEKTKDANKELEDERKRYLDAYNRWADAENKRIDEAEEKKKKQKKDAKTQEAKDYAEAQKMAQDMQDEQDKADKEALAKEAKKREDEYKMAVEKVEMLYSIYKEHKDKMAEANMEAIDYELQKNRDAVEQQLVLAAAGKQNTLDYELQKQNELEKARVTELERQKKAAKQQEAIELSLAFLKAYENYIGKDMKSGEALVRAFGDVSAAKLLGKALAGSAEKGVEDTGNNGLGLDGKGGMLWMLHPNEGVATKEGNTKYKGAIGAINEGKLEDWAANNLMLQNYNASLSVADGSKSKQVNESLTNMVIEKLEALTQVVKDKPESSINIDNLGNLWKRYKQNGVQTIIKRQNFIS